MLRFLPRPGSAVVEAYRSMRDELGRRPSPSELFHHGYLGKLGTGLLWLLTGGLFTIGWLDDFRTLNRQADECNRA